MPIVVTPNDTSCSVELRSPGTSPGGFGSKDDRHVFHFNSFSDVQEAEASTKIKSVVNIAERLGE
jgi:hypothetical protein